MSGPIHGIVARDDFRNKATSLETKRSNSHERKCGYEKKTEGTRIGKAAAGAFEELKEVFLIDVGTGSTSITGCSIDPKTGAVYYSTEKVEFKREKKKAEVFFQEVNTALNSPKYADNQKIGIRSAFAREPQNDDDRKLVELTDEWNNRPDFVINTVTIKEESRLSDISSKHIFEHKNKDNPTIKDVTFENTRAFQGGSGSLEGMGLSLEMGARWVEGELLLGRNLMDIYKPLRLAIMGAMEKGDEEKIHVLLQGLLAIGISNKDVMKHLKISKEQEMDWKSGQILKNFNSVIKALHLVAKKADRDGAAARKEAVSVLVALALLDAYADKCDLNRDEQLVMNAREPMPLDSQLYQLNDDVYSDKFGKHEKIPRKYAKVTTSHGLAVQYFKSVNHKLERLMPSRRHVTFHAA